MTIGINKVVLIGFIGAKPKHEVLPSGCAVASFSIATTKSWKDNTGQLCKDTQWHHIVCYGNKSEHVHQFLDKGNLCYVGGELRTHKWEGEDGVGRQRTEIILKEFRCLDRNPGISNTANMLPPPRVSNEAKLDDWLT